LFMSGVGYGNSCPWFSIYSRKFPASTTVMHNVLL
jgi:hypothetical protein